MTTKEQKLKPAIRWAGGKSWLIERMQNYLPKDFKTYHEPFIGGASLFLNLHIRKAAFISDINSELICFYNEVKNNLPALSKRIAQFENTIDVYYKIRNEKPKTDLGLAARFYYLNRTCFNGLYRVNSKGEFNVPFGYRNIEVLESKNLANLKSALQNAVITCCDFETALSKVNKGDFVFLDPPYTVAHNKNGFIEYNQNIFSWEDQERLNKCVKLLIEKEAYFIMTNAWHDSIKKLYKGVGRYFEIDRFSTISGKMNSRIKISEMLITNCI